MKNNQELSSDYQSEAALKLEEKLETLRSLWRSLSEESPSILASKLARWRETTLKIIDQLCVDLEESRFRKVSKNLTKNSSNITDLSLAATIEQVEAYLVGLLDSIWSQPENILKPQEKKSEQPSFTAVVNIPTDASPSTENSVSKVRRWTWENIGSHPLRVFFTTLLIAIPSTWYTAIEIRVEPLKLEIDFLRARLSNSPEVLSFKYQIVPSVDQNKEFFSKDPEALWSDIEKLTPSQSKAFIENYYKGKWIRLKAPIYSVYLSEDLGTIDFNNGKVKTVVLLLPDQYSKLNSLFKGKEVVIEGKFNSIFDGMISFDEGVLINPSS